MQGLSRSGTAWASHMGVLSSNPPGDRYLGHPRHPQNKAEVGDNPRHTRFSPKPLCAPESPYPRASKGCFSRVWKIQWNPNQGPSKLLCGYQQTDPKVHMERRRKAQNGPHNTEEGASLVVQLLRLSTPNAGAGTGYLLRDLRPHMLQLRFARRIDKGWSCKLQLRPDTTK